VDIAQHLDVANRHVAVNHRPDVSDGVRGVHRTGTGSDELRSVRA
jgi:hypothetical protein